MRIYNKYYRRKNPGKRRAVLRGEKKGIHSSLMKALKNPSRRRKNPDTGKIKPRGYGRAIDAFNLLGRLNKQIEAGNTDLIPLRDTIAARIEGYLGEETLDHSLSEALRGLSKAEISIVQQMIAESGGEVTPQERREISRRASKHPDVRRAQARVSKAKRLEKKVKKAFEREKLTGPEFLVGKERLAEMKAAERRAKEELRGREGPRMTALGKPFLLGPGFFGVVIEVKGQRGYRWHLIDQTGSIYMSGTVSAKNVASREVAIAYRIIKNLADLDDDAGWDNLPENDIRWLESKKPELSKMVARVLLQNINERRRVSRSTAQWIVSAADIGKYKTEEKKDMSQSCRNMTLGEERRFRGKAGKYTVVAKKGMRGTFTFYVETADGRISKSYRTKDCGEILRKGHLIGGAMSGASDVAKAVANPTKLSSLNNSAKRYFGKINPRKKNPKMPRQAAEVGDIRELSGMIGVPYDPEDAYRYGYYAGIIRGIDTCGVQNYFKRKKIRNEFQKRLLQAAMQTTAQVTGTRAPSFSSRKIPRKKAAESIYEDVESDIGKIFKEE